MRSTLLEAVQEILAALDSDEANSISDTVEADQVARILRATYYDCAVDIQLLEHNTVFGLTASGDDDKPVLMTLPDNVTRLDNIKYDNKEDGENPDYLPVAWMDFDDFVVHQQSLRNETTNVDSLVIEGDNDDEFTIMYRTDKHPQYYTTYNNRTIVFDSYNSDVDTTLQQSKTMCAGVVYPEFSMEDDFIVDLDPTQFRYWINKAKVRAFNELKQVVNTEAANEARRQKVIVQKRKHSIATKPAIDQIAAKYGRK